MMNDVVNNVQMGGCVGGFELYWIEGERERER